MLNGVPGPRQVRIGRRRALGHALGGLTSMAYLIWGKMMATGGRVNPGGAQR